MNIESVNLSIWTIEGENIEIELESWQVSAIGTMLGINVSESLDTQNVYDIRMLAPQEVEKRIKAINNMYKKINKTNEKNHQ